jgi:O-methyltransferase
MIVFANSQNIIFKIVFKLLTVLEKILLKFGVVLIRATPCLGRKRRMDMSYRAWDFNRYSSLEFCAHEIIEKNIEGAIAELGVFEGTFACKMNELFPNKKLYLFDTFEGFDSRDLALEKKEGFSGGGQEIDFSNTSIEIVKSKMKYIENCIFKKGYFPDTAKNLDESFCFVSIDTDLYLPIYEGLKYFYPRLQQGGYIFIHDYNNKYFTGAKEAVKKYCSENSIGYFPLSDVGGTVVISK